MTAIDILIILILLFGAYMGVRRGIIIQVFSIIAIFVGSWISFTFSSALSGWLAPVFHLEEDYWLTIVSYVLIFIGIIILFRLLAKVVERMFKHATLEWLNKGAGAVFSVVKYTLILGVLFVIFHSGNHRYGWVDENKLSESKVYVFVKDVGYTVFPYFENLLKGKYAPDPEALKSEEDA